MGDVDRAVAQVAQVWSRTFSVFISLKEHLLVELCVRSGR
jgi:hypothetical protein